MSREDELLSFAKARIDGHRFFALIMLHCMKPFDIDLDAQRSLLAILLKNESLMRAHLRP